MRKNEEVGFPVTGTVLTFLVSSSLTSPPSLASRSPFNLPKLGEAGITPAWFFTQLSKKRKRDLRHFRASFRLPALGPWTSTTKQGLGPHRRPFLSFREEPLLGPHQLGWSVVLWWSLNSKSAIAIISTTHLYSALCSFVCMCRDFSIRYSASDSGGSCRTAARSALPL